MAKWYKYERVLPRFLRTAQQIHTVDQRVEAVVLPDPKTGSTQSLQIGTHQFAKVKFSRSESEIIEWDPPHKLAWCVRRSTFPWGHAQIDQFEVAANASSELSAVSVLGVQS